MDEEIKQTQTLKVVKQSKSNRKYVINIVIILMITFGYTFFSLSSDWNDVVAVFNSSDSDFSLLLVVALLIALKFFIEGLILFIFARLYTPSYKLHRGIANGMVGQFYSDITPNSSGGQFFQVKTFAKQGVPVAVSASILVMHFILFQIVLVLFGGFAILLNIKEFARLGTIPIFDLNIPVWVLSLFGFFINLITIVGLFLLSFSKKAHNVVINYGVDLFAKMRIVKNPVERKEKLYIATENFRVELQRLSANLPASILVMALFLSKFIVNFSVTYFSALTLDPSLVSTMSYWDSISKSSFLMMITSFIPIPGAAGFAEYFFVIIFEPLFGKGTSFAKAVQIVWRFASFYFSLLAGGLVTAFYRSSMEEIVDEEGKIQTFEQVKSYTFVERAESSHTLYETSQLSIKEIQRRLQGKKKTTTNIKKDDE